MRAWCAAVPLLFAAACSRGSGTLQPGVEQALAFERAPEHGYDGALLSEVVVRVAPPRAVLVSLSARSEIGVSTLVGNAVAVEGLARFRPFALAAGRYRLVAESPGAARVESAPLQVDPAPAALRFAVQPSDAFVGELLSPVVVVQVEDRFARRVPIDGLEIALGWFRGELFTGAVQRAATRGGMARFEGLRAEELAADNHLLAESEGLTRAESQRFAVRTTPPARLAWLTPPPLTVYAHLPLGTVAVEALDAEGERYLDGDLQLSVESVGGSAALLGTTVERSRSGVVRYSDLAYPVAERIQLRVSAPGVEPLLSRPIEVLPAPEPLLRLGGATPGQPVGVVSLSLSGDGQRVVYDCRSCPAPAGSASTVSASWTSGQGATPCSTGTTWAWPRTTGISWGSSPQTGGAWCSTPRPPTMWPPIATASWRMCITAT